MNRLKLIPLMGCLLLALSACTDEMIVTDPTPPPTTPNGAPKPPPVTPGKSKNTYAPAHLSKQKPSPMVGGYSAANPDDQDVFEMNKAMEQELYASGKEIWTKKILKAEKQIVAGTNYRLTLLMSDGNKYQAVIYKDLQNTVELTSFQKL